ncbi:hypothetical protein [Candidatus Similichlamydia epinepheli]|uniref:hypothetical protein n=1 Tax=Candidatus Similichlamydia epinepheli TaxID=1903953 RepID=UPI000D3B3E64|nr:hypothetical protein [Candidatus Similichlamydia epinepheli]
MQRDRKTIVAHILFLVSLFPLQVIIGNLSYQKSSILFYGTTPYAVETKLITPNPQKYYDRIELIKFPGIRVHAIHFNGRMVRKAFRAILKTNYCLRAGANHRATTICTTAIKILLQQSWAKNLASMDSAKAIMTVSGPGFDGNSVHISDISKQLLPIIRGIKTATISQAELNTIENSFTKYLHRIYGPVENSFTKYLNTELNRTPDGVANRMMSRLSEPPTTSNLIESSVYPYIRGIPSASLDKMHLKNLTIKDCENVISDWTRAPLEIFFMDNTKPTATEFIEAILPLWDELRPDTRYKLAQSDAGFTTKGAITLFSCPGAPITEMVPVIVLNLGKLTPVSLIAADILCTRFAEYTNRNESLNNTPSYLATWAPCGGCVLVMIRFSDTMFLSKQKMNALRALQISLSTFRESFSCSELKSNLFNDWIDSIGVNQSKLDLDQWTSFNLTKASGYLDWMVDVYGFEDSFHELNILRNEINETGPSITLCEDIHKLLQERLSDNKHFFDIWVFRGST